MWVLSEAKENPYPQQKNRLGEMSHWFTILNDEHKIRGKISGVFSESLRPIHGRIPGAEDLRTQVTPYSSVQMYVLHIGEPST